MWASQSPEGSSHCAQRRTCQREQCPRLSTNLIHQSHWAAKKKGATFAAVLARNGPLPLGRQYGPQGGPRPKSQPLNTGVHRPFYDTCGNRCDQYSSCPSPVIHTHRTHFSPSCSGRTPTAVGRARKTGELGRHHRARPPRQGLHSQPPRVRPTLLTRGPAPDHCCRPSLPRRVPRGRGCPAAGAAALQPGPALRPRPTRAICATGGRRAAPPPRWAVRWDPAACGSQRPGGPQRSPPPAWGTRCGRRRTARGCWSYWLAGQPCACA